MHSLKSHIIVLLLAVVALVSCHENGTNERHSITAIATPSDTTEWLSGRDYGRNFNFVVRTDSLYISRQSPEENIAQLPVDTICIDRNAVVAVVDYRIMPLDSVDSVWVQIAWNAEDMGWVHESALLQQVSPDDPISLFIDFFSSTHRRVLIVLLLIIVSVYLLRNNNNRKNAYLIHLRDINSFYPTLLAITVALTATVYGTIQHLCPQLWHYFYFHPSLNPFIQPLPIALFITLFWLIIIVAIAAIDDVMRLLTPTSALIYLTALATLCAINHVVFSLAAQVWIGYLLFVVYTAFALWRYFRHNRTHYICGYCGKRIKQKGRCPHCNAVNE